MPIISITDLPSIDLHYLVIDFLTLSIDSKTYLLIRLLALLRLFWLSPTADQRPHTSILGFLNKPWASIGLSAASMRCKEKFAAINKLVAKTNDRLDAMLVRVSLSENELGSRIW